MTGLALLLVLAAALLNATWNYWAKRAGGGLPFVYLVAIFICTGYVPVMVWYFHSHPVVWSGKLVAAIAISGILKTGYSLFLQRGYRLGDFSLIYPLARGTGPLLSSLGAMAMLGEHPSLVAAAGAATIVVSIFWIAGGHRWFGRANGDAPPVGAEKSNTGRAAFYGLGAGVFIATYTLWDKRGVAALHIDPVLYDCGTAYTMLGLLAPIAWRRRGDIAREWREHRKNAIIMATTSPVGYILFLVALRASSVSYVAPAREVSILIGLFFGARWLNEREVHRRWWAAAAMVAGLAALAVG